jgi:hypothetical protein
MEVPSISSEHLSHEINLLHETRHNPVDRPSDRSFSLRSHAGTATFANRLEERSGIFSRTGLLLVSLLMVRRRAEGGGLPVNAHVTPECYPEQVSDAEQGRAG